MGKLKTILKTKKHIIAKREVFSFSILSAFILVKRMEADAKNRKKEFIVLE